MPISQEIITQYNDLQAEKVELETELRRIDAFLTREPNNRDNARAVNAGKIRVKFAGTACMLPTGIFTGALNQRKAELNQRLSAIEAELNTL